MSARGSLVSEESSDLNKRLSLYYRESLSLRDKSITSETSLDSNRLYFNLGHFYRDADKCRILYYDKLIMKFQLLGSKTKRDYNSIIFFDWDDTLFCSSYLTKKKLLNRQSMENLGPRFIEKLKKVEKTVVNIIKLSITHGDTYIITNATKYWVEYSCSLIYPNVLDLLSKVCVISARDNYEKKYPNDPKKWKLQTFIDLANTYDKNVVTNIISIGDSECEAEAGLELGNIFRESYIKIIKFKEDPKPDQLIKELSLVENEFNNLHSAVRNISIHVEKKAKS